jgi:hypothetical protein
MLNNNQRKEIILIPSENGTYVPMLTAFVRVADWLET